MGIGKWFVALVAMVSGLVITSPARAAFSVTASGGPTTATAGAHSDVKINLGFPDSGQDLKRLVIHLPKGLVGNPNATTTRCSEASFNANNCTTAQQVGEVTSQATALGLPITIPGDIYNLTPRGGEPARLGIHLTPPLGASEIHLQAVISLRADYGLDNVIETDIPRTTVVPLLGTQDIYLSSMAMTLYAKTSTGGVFMTNPTECGTHTFSVDAASWAAPTAWKTGSGSFTINGCNRAPFSPTFAIAPNQQTGDQPTDVSVTIGFPGDAGGLSQSNLKSAEVVLPVGTALSPGVGANGLEACSDGQFAINSTGTPACPGLSKVGTVKFDTPLLGTLNGDVFLGAPTPGAPLRLFAFATKGDVTVKLAGRVTPDPSTGQLTTSFSDLPRVPFTAFTLSFRGGDAAVLKAPPTCGTNTATAKLEPYANPGTFKTVNASFTTVNCPSGAFAPSLSASVAPTQAAANSAMTMTIARGDDQPLLDGMKVSLPPGALGHLASIPGCAVETARAGNCPEASRVGTVTAVAGTGGAPASLVGPIYLTGPVGDGLAGLAVVVPAKVGPIDLGNVVVLTKLSVRPDVGIDVTATDLPRIAGGVPLAIRSMKLALDRDGFLFNASSCAARTIDATFTAQNGATAAASAPYQPTGCENVPFGPKLTATIGGSFDAPSLSTTIEAPPGQATLSGVQLTLPVQLGADLGALAKVCMKETYDAGQCPPVSRIGTATAISPLIPLPLSGPVTLLRLPGRALPSLAIDLAGVLNVHLQADNDSAGGRLRSTVAGIPDVPLSSFTLNLDSGGLLKSDRKMLCTGIPKVDAAFTAHTGARTTTSAVADTPCAGGLSKLTATGSLRGAGKGRTPSLRVKVRGTKLRSLRVTLPKQLRLSTKRLKRGGRVYQAGKAVSRKTKKGKRALRHTKRSVTGWTTKKHTGSIELRLAKGALRKGKGLKAGKRLTLKLRVTDSAGRSRSLNLRIKAKR